MVFKSDNMILYHIVKMADDLIKFLGYVGINDSQKTHPFCRYNDARYYQL